MMFPYDPYIDAKPYNAPLNPELPKETILVSVPDPVHNPAHYTQFPVEVIEITEHLNFCLGNVVKYVCRADFKGNKLEDLKKAQWYLSREIARLESGK